MDRIRGRALGALDQLATHAHADGIARQRAGDGAVVEVAPAGAGIAGRVDAGGEGEHFMDADEAPGRHDAAGAAHEVTFPDVLVKSELLGEAPETIFLCIVPEQYKELDMDMSAFLFDKFTDVEKRLLAELNQIGVYPERLPDA